MEAGRQSRDVGPVLTATTMDAGRPQQAVPPAVPEALVNVDVGRGGRVVARPGSHFVSRIGRGPVLGLHDHSFETGGPRRLAAVVADHLLEVNTLDPFAEGGGQDSVAFCPDVLVHGEPLHPIRARPTDRFHFQSFLDRLYFAGSTVSSLLYEHDYAANITRPITGVRARSVAAVGNRLFVAGDPEQPNTVFPSDPDEPSTFQPQLGFRLGTGTDGIVALREHQGLLVAFGERSCSWALPGAIDIGDLQAETFTKEHGIAGPLAVTTGGDGILYWLTREDGIVRWARGSSSVDAEFSEPVRTILQAVSEGVSREEFSGTVAAWDPLRQAVRFEIPGANLLLSYFPYADGAWTVGSTTTTPRRIAEIRDYDSLDTARGEDRYTALAGRRDPFTEAPQLMGGDAEGHIWLWREFQPDKLRWQLGNGAPFRTLVRYGNVELAPIGYRAVIEELLAVIEAGYECEFELWADRDFAGFEFVEAGSWSQEGGELPLLLSSVATDASRLTERRLSPIHVRLGNWDVLVAKAFRLEVLWDCLQHMAMVGLQMEVSPEAEDAYDVRYPPRIPDGTVTTFPPPEEGTGELDEDGVSDPHDPPENPNVPPDVTYLAAGSIGETNTDEFALVRFSQDPLGTGLAKQFEEEDWGTTYQALTGFGHIVVSSDESSVWTVGSAQDNDDSVLMHFSVDRTDLPATVLDYQYDMFPDCLTNAATSGSRGLYGPTGMAYLEERGELWVAMHHAGGNNNNFATILCYDVSTPGVEPTLIFASNPDGDWFNQCFGLEFTSSGTLVLIVQGFLELYSVTRDGSGVPTAIVAQGSVGVGGSAVGRYEIRVWGDSMCALTTTQSDQIRVYDIRDPNAPSLMAAYDFDVSGPGGSFAQGPTWSADGTRLFCNLRVGANASGTPSYGQDLVGFDTSDLLGAGLVEEARYEDLTLLANSQQKGNTAFYQGPDGESAVVFWLTHDGLVLTVDVSAVPYQLIESAPLSITKGFTLGMAGLTDVPMFTTDGGSTEPDAVAANLIAMKDGENIVVAGVDDPAAPVLQAFASHPDLLQPVEEGIAWAFNGAFLYGLSGRTGTLFVYQTERDMEKVAEVADAELVGCYGLIAGLNEVSLYALNADAELVTIDVTDPASPSVSAAAASSLATPQTPWTRTTMERRGDIAVLRESNHAALLNTSTGSLSERLRPDTQRGLKLVDADATYLYGWNDRSPAGIAVVDHTQAHHPTVGYLEESWMADVVDLAAGDGFVAAVTSDELRIVSVATPSAPATVATVALPGVTSVDAVGDQVLVTGGPGVAWGLRLYDVSTPATPSLADSIATSDPCDEVAVLGTTTGAVYFDGTVWRTVSVGAGSLTAEGSVAPPGSPNVWAATAVATSKVAYAHGDGVYLIDCTTIGSPTIGSALSLVSPLAIGATPTGSTGVALSFNIGTMDYQPRFFSTSGSAPEERTDLVMTAQEEAEVRAHAYQAVGVGSGTLLIARDVAGRGLSKIQASNLSVVSTRPSAVVSELLLEPGVGSGVGVQRIPFRVYPADMTDAERPTLRLPYSSPEADRYAIGPLALSDDGNTLAVGRQEGTHTSLDGDASLFVEPGLYLYDVTDSEAVTRVGRYLTDGPVRALALDSAASIAYVVTGYRTSPPVPSQLLALDISTPASPALLGSVELPSGFHPSVMELY